MSTSNFFITLTLVLNFAVFVSALFEHNWGRAIYFLGAVLITGTLFKL